MPVPRTLTSAHFMTSSSRLSRGPGPPRSAERWSSPPHRTSVDGLRDLRLGSVCRLALEPGARAPRADDSPGRSDRSSRPESDLWDRHAEQFTSSATGYARHSGRPTASNTAPTPVRWSSLHHLGCGSSRRAAPGFARVRGRGRPHRQLGRRIDGHARRAPVPPVVRSPGRRSGPRLLVERQARLRDGAELRHAPGGVRYDQADGTRVRLLASGGINFGGSTHTVSQTRDWIILADSGNFKPDPAEMFGGERVLQIDDEVAVWMVRKEELDTLASGTPVTPVAAGCRHPPGTSTLAGRTATASRWCGRAWTSWTSPST